MFTYAILLWILLNMHAPVRYYVLLGVAAIFTCIKAGMVLAKKE